MDEDYCCVSSCNHKPFQTRRQLSAHQRHCTEAKAHKAYIATLSTARRKADEDLEPPAKRLCVAEPGTGGISSPPSRLPDPTPTPSTSTLPAIEASRAQAPPPRLTRAQARRIDTTFRRERDALPEAPPPLPPPSTDNLDNGARQAALPAQRLHVRAPFRTDPDIFGRYRVYYSRPPTIPDANAPMAHIVPVVPTPSVSCPRSVRDIISPCPNMTVFYILRYHWLAGHTKSIKDRDYLCNEVILQPDFRPQDLIGVNLNAIDNALAAAANAWDPSCPPAEGWKNVPLKLRVPTPSAALPKKTRK
ncbi:hypothetical protein FRC07_009390, partial [Ceratobasidium sp. 392]